jgi:osmotically-inducible protein OsmY
MGNKMGGRNFPRASRQPRNDEHESRYNTAGYYHHNEALSNSRNDPDEPGQTFPRYDDRNTGKYENYSGDGYYGSYYSGLTNARTGRDYEQDAGYRDSYNRLPNEQWPEVEQAARSRGMDPWFREDQTKGLHKGKGPKSYKRSDFRILEDINDLLMEDPYVDASGIEVTVQDGEVILSGQVDDRNVKRRVEDLAESVSGVKHLENRLHTRHAGGQIVNVRNH